jgi:CheY-like chemotaxis protein
MPLKNGLEVLNEVKVIYKSFPSLVKPKIIFVSSHGESKAFREHCEKSGVEKVFSKPVEASELAWIKKKFAK